MFFLYEKNILNLFYFEKNVDLVPPNTYVIVLSWVVYKTRVCWSISKTFMICLQLKQQNFTKKKREYDELLSNESFAMNAIIEVHSNFSEKVFKNSENCNVSCISFKSFPFSLCTVVSFKTHCLPSIGLNPIYLLLTYKKINFFSPLKHSFSLTLLHIKHLLRSN